MARTRELRKRITAVKTIQRITKTMQMIATTRFTAAQQRVLAARPYAQRMVQLVGEVMAAAAASGGFEHKLLAAPVPRASRERLLVITSNRGLCGAYNSNVLRAAMAHIRQLAERGAELELETAGKKAAAYFKFQKIAVSAAHKLSDRPLYEELEGLADRYMSDFLQGRLDAVRVAFMHFASSSRQTPQVKQLLPLPPAAAPAAARGPSALYEFSPSAPAILEDLIPLVVKTMLFQAALDATVSEQIMRMVAMKAATENARDLSRTFTRRYNRARQSQITTELMEVIGGAAALE